MGLGLEEAHYTSKGLRAKWKWSLEGPSFAVTLSFEWLHLPELRLAELTKTFWDSIILISKTKTTPSSELLNLETHKAQLVALDKCYLRYSYSRINNVIMSQNAVKTYQAYIESIQLSPHTGETNANFIAHPMSISYSVGSQWEKKVCAPYQQNKIIFFRLNIMLKFHGSRGYTGLSLSSYKNSLRNPLIKQWKEKWNKL